MNLLIFRMHTLDIDDRPERLELLSKFYHELFAREFPDPDERESLENMVQYLRLKSEGWYGKNSYHIILLLDEAEKIIGGLVGDYFFESNCGVIEFIVVDKSLRGLGLGKVLLNTAIDRFKSDSYQAGYESINGVAAEVNDPYRRCEVKEHLDGFARLKLWHRLGFSLLDFPYVQPALGPEQSAVTGLGLMFRPEGEIIAGGVSSQMVVQFLKDYMVWAMRIPNPEKVLEFQMMQQYLADFQTVKALNMNEYVGEVEEPAFHVQSLDSAMIRNDSVFYDLYRSHFNSPDTSIDLSDFEQELNESVINQLYNYHLWGLISNKGGKLAGFASFFALPNCGFGGYLAFDSMLRGRGYLRCLLRMMEREMVSFNDKASGWYLECEPDSYEGKVFMNCGFKAVPIHYLQPDLKANFHNENGGKILTLYYKPFGRIYYPFAISKKDLIRDLNDIFTYVYKMDSDHASGYAEKLAESFQ